MQTRTIGKVAVFCFGAALPFMAAGQAHASPAPAPIANSAVTATQAAAGSDGSVSGTISGVLDSLGAAVDDLGGVLNELGALISS